MDVSKELENLVSTRIRDRKADITAVTLRIPDRELISVDEIASQLNLTRQDILLQFVTYGIKTTQEMIAKYDAEEIVSDIPVTNTINYYLLNTNTRDGMDDHNKMLSEGCAAAFWGVKHNINRLKQGDRVFFWQNGHGIVATGVASGNTIVSRHNDDDYDNDQAHSQKLDKFQKDFQITLKSCKDITKTNLPILRTMSQLNEDQGKALLKEVERIKGKK